MSQLQSSELEFLYDKAEEIRESIVTMLEEAGSGHTAGPLGMTDIFTALYFKVLKHNPQNPLWEHRDRLILSNGHIAPVLYASLAHAGYFRVEELLTLRKFGSRLQGHPHRTTCPGVDTSSGPLGEGLSQAIGMAWVDRLDNHKPDRYFYCLMGDGELNEGQIWESLFLLGREKLHKLICVIDRNNIQIDGPTESVLPLEPLRQKFESFNLNVIDINGHDMREIISAFEKAKMIIEKPTVIIAHTIPGKGVPEIEGDFHWHGKAPNQKEAEMMLRELRTMKGKLTHVID